MQIANTILAQLGGAKFLAMTGAKNLLGDEKALTFTLPSNFANHKINRVRVTLTPADTYTVEFYRVRGIKCDRFAAVENVYCDNLAECFTRITGLDTSL